MATGKYRIFNTIGVTINTSSDTSTVSEFDGGSTLIAIVFPIAMDGAYINFLASNDGVNFYNMFNSAGTELKVDFIANGWVALVPADFASARYIKIVTPTNQTTSRVFQLISRAYD